MDSPLERQAHTARYVSTVKGSQQAQPPGPYPHAEECDSETTEDERDLTHMHAPKHKQRQHGSTVDDKTRRATSAKAAENRSGASGRSGRQLSPSQRQRPASGPTLRGSHAPRLPPRRKYNDDMDYDYDDYDEDAVSPDDSPRVKRSGGQGCGNGRSKRGMRRPVQFWAPFNEWWRSELEASGKRPGHEEVGMWYEGHAEATWGADAPSLEETRTHAKCLRSVGSIREYFRTYRARKKQKQEEEPADMHHGALDYGSLPLAALSLLPGLYGSFPSAHAHAHPAAAAAAFAALHQQPPSGMTAALAAALHHQAAMQQSGAMEAAAMSALLASAIPHRATITTGVAGGQGPQLSGQNSLASAASRPPPGAYPPPAPGGQAAPRRAVTTSTAHVTTAVVPPPPLPPLRTSTPSGGMQKADALRPSPFERVAGPQFRQSPRSSTPGTPTRQSPMQGSPRGMSNAVQLPAAHQQLQQHMHHQMQQQLQSKGHSFAQPLFIMQGGDATAVVHAIPRASPRDQASGPQLLHGPPLFVSPFAISPAEFARLHGQQQQHRAEAAAAMAVMVPPPSLEPPPGPASPLMSPTTASAVMQLLETGRLDDLQQQQQQLGGLPFPGFRNGPSPPDAQNAGAADVRRGPRAPVLAAKPALPQPRKEATAPAVAAGGVLAEAAAAAAEYAAPLGNAPAPAQPPPLPPLPLIQAPIKLENRGALGEGELPPLPMWAAEEQLPQAPVVVLEQAPAAATPRPECDAAPGGLEALLGGLGRGQLVSLLVKTLRAKQGPGEDVGPGMDELLMQALQHQDVSSGLQQVPTGSDTQAAARSELSRRPLPSPAATAQQQRLSVYSAGGTNGSSGGMHTAEDDTTAAPGVASGVPMSASDTSFQAMKGRPLSVAGSEAGPGSAVQATAAVAAEMAGHQGPHPHRLKGQFHQPHARAGERPSGAMGADASGGDGSVGAPVHPAGSSDASVARGAECGASDGGSGSSSIRF